MPRSITISRTHVLRPFCIWLSAPPLPHASPDAGNPRQLLMTSCSRLCGGTQTAVRRVLICLSYRRYPMSYANVAFWLRVPRAAKPLVHNTSTYPFIQQRMALANRAPTSVLHVNTMLVPPEQTIVICNSYISAPRTASLRVSKRTDMFFSYDVLCSSTPSRTRPPPRTQSSPSSYTRICNGRRAPGHHARTPTCLGSRYAMIVY